METAPQYLIATTHDELLAFVKSAGQSRFRADQIHKWLFESLVIDPERMENLPKALRQQLTEAFSCGKCYVSGAVESRDGTKKLLLSLDDSETIEAVLIPSDDRLTFCLSTQVGCPVKCRFCASGQDGLVRNLKTGEILEQFVRCCEDAGRRPDNIVFMGIGEGLLNLPNLIPALGCLSDSERIGMAPRRITVSTSGWVEGIRALADCQKQWNLAVSLHAPTDDVRAQLIPDHYRCSIADILAACQYYRDMTNRMVTFEYTLLAGINDSLEQAEQMARLARRSRAKVNLIPFNDTQTEEFRRPDEATVRRFLQVLLDAGVQATRRAERGRTEGAACGQLRIASRSAS